jgi:fibronectin type 3 domain-containing protein
MTFPATLAPGATATLNVQFDPANSTAYSGGLTINSNSSGNGTIAIPVSGTGIPQPQVILTWQAPTPTGAPIAGYNVYRALSGNSSYTTLNASLITGTSFTDTTPQFNDNYQYYVTSVDTTGAESVSSNAITISIP